MDLRKAERALVLAPHADDAELGCGGTIAKLVAGGTQVFVIVCSLGESHLGESMDSQKVLGTAKLIVTPGVKTRHFLRSRQGILQEFINQRKKVKPDLVLMPCPNDMHQDHQIVAQEGLRAFARNSTCLGYEMPWNWTGLTNCHVVLDERHLAIKFAAVQCYSSQSEKFYASRDYLAAMAVAAGSRCGHKWAEGFKALSVIL